LSVRYFNKGAIKIRFLYLYLYSKISSDAVDHTNPYGEDRDIGLTEIDRC